MRYLTFVLIFCLCAVAVICGAHKTTPHVVKDINDARNGEMPGEAVRQHKYHDMAVYRYVKEGNNYYEVRFYCNAEDTLFCFHLDWFSESNLAKVSYSWNNDTLVTVRLYEQHGKMARKFLLLGSQKNGVNNAVSLHVH